MSEEQKEYEIDPPIELMVIEVQDDFLPALSLEQAIERHTQVKELVSSLMIDGVDYGQIPGTQKPSLWKPGAEKLTTFFGLRVLFIDEKVIEQWDDDDPLFYYRRKCQLWKGNVLIAEASGSANSREDRYRWRWVSAEAVPDGDITNLKTKGGKKGMFEWQFEARQTDGQYGKPEEYYEEIDKKIANNQVDRFVKVQHWNKQEAIYMEWEEILYRVPNEEIFSLVNTILKMADKRAFVGATLIACNASDYFTQDIEDIPEMNKTNIQPTKQTKNKPVENKPVDAENLILNSLGAMKDGTFTGNEYLDLGNGLGYDKVYVGEIKRKHETKDEKTKKTTTDFVSAAHELIEKYQTANS